MPLHFVQPPSRRRSLRRARVSLVANCRSTFDLDFPDNLGVPTDTSPYLSERGINGQQLFNCRYEDNMRRRFEKTVRQLVLTIALPYPRQNSDDLGYDPFLKHPYTLGFALHHVGRIEEAKELLVRERVRFAGLDLNDPGVAGVARGSRRFSRRKTRTAAREARSEQ